MHAGDGGEAVLVGARVRVRVKVRVRVRVKASEGVDLTLKQASVHLTFLLLTFLLVVSDVSTNSSRDWRTWLGLGPRLGGFGSGMVAWASHRLLRAIEGVSVQLLHLPRVARAPGELAVQVELVIRRELEGVPRVESARIAPRVGQAGCAI